MRRGAKSSGGSGAWGGHVRFCSPLIPVSVHRVMGSKVLSEHPQVLLRGAAVFPWPGTGRSRSWGQVLCRQPWELALSPCRAAGTRHLPKGTFLASQAGPGVPGRTETVTAENSSVGLERGGLMGFLSPVPAGPRLPVHQGSREEHPHCVPDDRLPHC